jgi:hypothetical protein
MHRAPTQSRRREAASFSDGNQMNAQTALRVLYIDGEMHIADIQERVRMLRHAVPSVNQEKAGENIRFLAGSIKTPKPTFR